MLEELLVLPRGMVALLPYAQHVIIPGPASKLYGFNSGYG
jgi:hypothetical protein